MATRQEQLRERRRYVEALEQQSKGKRRRWYSMGYGDGLAYAEALAAGDGVTITRARGVLVLIARRRAEVLHQAHAVSAQEGAGLLGQWEALGWAAELLATALDLEVPWEQQGDNPGKELPADVTPAPWPHGVPINERYFLGLAGYEPPARRPYGFSGEPPRAWEDPITELMYPSQDAQEPLRCSACHQPIRGGQSFHLQEGVATHVSPCPEPSDG